MAVSQREEQVVLNPEPVQKLQNGYQHRSGPLWVACVVGFVDASRGLTGIVPWRPSRLATTTAIVDTDANARPTTKLPPQPQWNGEKRAITVQRMPPKQPEIMLPTMIDFINLGATATVRHDVG